MSPLQRQLIEFLAHNKYASISCFCSVFTNHRKDSISKTLRSMMHNKLISRQQDLDPITLRREFVYYIAPKGAKELMKCFDFADIKEIECPRSHSTLFHDLSATYFKHLFQKDFHFYYTEDLRQLSMESRQSCPQKIVL